MTDLLRRLARNPGALTGLCLVAGLVLLALLAGVLAPAPPNRQDWGQRLLPPSLAHPFGTDEFGRDLLSRTLHGGRVSLLAGFLPVVLGAVIGATLGLAAGYFGGWLDEGLMRAMDILLAFPSVFLALAIVGALGPGFGNAVVAVAIVSIPSYARIVRGEVLKLKREEFVEAARTLGARHLRIIVRHVLPNVLSPLIVQATLSVGFAILSTAGLSFLGLGVQPPTSDWGEMLSSGRKYLPEAWWLEVFPGLFIMAAVLGVNLLGDGLRDALDPKLRR
ncbi:MAG: ABC transporter permease [Chitinophagales bacterium]